MTAGSTGFLNRVPWSAKASVNSSWLLRIGGGQGNHVRDIAAFTTHSVSYGAIGKNPIKEELLASGLFAHS